MQEMHIALKLYDGWESCPNRGRQPVQELHQFRWFGSQVTVSGKEIVGR
jgi:hypothetical protein